MSDLFVQIIRNTRLRIGEPPRTFAPREQRYLEAKPPAWCRRGENEYYAIYEKRQLLLAQGTVVWGVTTQANTALFAPGSEDAPGSTVYCSEPHWHDDLLRLSNMSDEITALRQGGGKNAKEKEIGRRLADERTPFMAHPVPASIAGTAPVLTGCHMFIRKHLPAQILARNYFPLLVHPNTKAVFVVPARYWDPELVAMWSRERD